MVDKTITIDWNHFARKLNHSSIILATFFMLVIKFASAQNIYDYEHTKTYSKYLFDSKQFKLASEELERAVFFDKDNDSIKFQLIRSYLLGNEFGMLAKRIDSLFPDQATMPRNYAYEYSKALLSSLSISHARKFIDNNHCLTDNDRLYLNLNAGLLDYQWETAQTTFRELKNKNLMLDTRYDDLFYRINSTKYKSPGLAFALSAAVPGMGKVYTNNWKDGLISFIFVGGTTLQAVRGYRNYGKSSGFFIAYSSIATTFYLANLYGSFKSAKKHNEKLRKQIHSAIRTVFNDTL